MKFTKFILILSCLFILSCGMYKKVDQREMPDTAKAKARKNIEEGRGAGLAGIMKRRGNTNYEFSTSNPMWRASLETMDFLPLTTVDYSGGMIVSDWYTDSKSADEAIKISIRFLSNQRRITFYDFKKSSFVRKTIQNKKINLKWNGLIFK